MSQVTLVQEDKGCSESVLSLEVASNRGSQSSLWKEDCGDGGDHRGKGNRKQYRRGDVTADT